MSGLAVYCFAQSMQSRPRGHAHKTHPKIEKQPRKSGKGTCVVKFRVLVPRHNRNDHQPQKILGPRLLLTWEINSLSWFCVTITAVGKFPTWTRRHFLEACMSAWRFCPLCCCPRPRALIATSAICLLVPTGTPRALWVFPPRASAAATCAAGNPIFNENLWRIHLILRILYTPWRRPVSSAWNVAFDPASPATNPKPQIPEIPENPENLNLKIKNNELSVPEPRPSTPPAQQQPTLLTTARHWGGQRSRAGVRHGGAGRRVSRLWFRGLVESLSL
jgi:hypothetical protein